MERKFNSQIYDSEGPARTVPQHQPQHAETYVSFLKNSYANVFWRHVGHGVAVSTQIISAHMTQLHFQWLTLYIRGNYPITDSQNYLSGILVDNCCLIPGGTPQFRLLQIRNLAKRWRLSCKHMHAQRWQYPDCVDKHLFSSIENVNRYYKNHWVWV